MTATELLAEMLRLYDDPDSSAWQLYEWVHRHLDEIRTQLKGEVDANEN